MTRPTAAEIKGMARVAGIPVDDTVAARTVNTIGPALEGFSEIAGTLPFDLEPSHFILAQTKKAKP